jgi:PHD/YefM family antitoxin component YafN of YafNO toxin-antitoxin module
VNIIFHYPPELLNLLIDTIPLLCRSKKDVLLFFKGAGVASDLTNDLAIRVNQDPNSISKYEIARTVLTRLNEKGELTLRERREIWKRVTEFEDFSTCWPKDQLKAKGLVAEIRRVVNVKDSFTRMHMEREDERKKRQAEQQAKLEEAERRRAKLSAVKTDLFSLFGEQNSQKRGKALEGVLNRLFETSAILIRETFTLKGSHGEGIIEQIDGVVEIDGELYLVEMKWMNQPLGTSDVSQHLVRIFNRGHARGIFISASDYTEPAITICKESLQKAVVVLCKLEEIVRLLEQEGNLKDLLKAKIKAAIIDKNPLHEPLGRDVL